MIVTTNLAGLPYKDTSITDRPGEYWDDIPGLDGLYLISNFGRVKRLERLQYDVLGRQRVIPAKIKVPQVNRDRNMLKKDWTYRLQASIQVENQTYHYQIARLVYYCFVAPFNMEDASLIVTVKNGNGFDIHPENLLLLTYSGKNHRSYDIGRQLSHFTTNKLKHIEVIEIIRKKASKVISQYNKEGICVRTYKSIVEAARLTGIAHSLICFAAQHRTNTAGGFYWREGDADKINRKEIQDHQVKMRSSYRQKKGKPVTQFDLDGNILASYCAKSVASKKTSIPHKLITQNIDGQIEHAGGYIWRSGNLLSDTSAPFHTYQVADREINGKKLTLSDCRRRDKADRGIFSVGTKVTQFKMNGEPIARYNTLQAAADAVNCRYQRIALAIKGKTKTVAGYIWRAGFYDQCLVL